MYIIIIGCGRTGGKLANILSDENHNLVVVDKDSKAFEVLDPSFNGITIEGNGIDEQVLQEAGIEKADALLAMTNDDNTNIMSAQVAKKIFDVDQVITKVNNQGREYLYRDLGLETINVTKIGAYEIRNVLLKNEFQRYFIEEKDGIEIITVEIKEELIERIRAQEENTDINLLAVIRSGEVINLKAIENLQLGDKAVFIAKGDGYKRILSEEGGIV